MTCDKRLRIAPQAAHPCAPSSQSKKAASPSRPYLMTSAMPARNSRGGKDARVEASAITAIGLVEGTDQVLAAGVVHTGLAAHG